MVIVQNLVLEFRADLVFALFVQFLHPFRHLDCIMVGFFDLQSFQVAGNQDIHGGRNGLV